MPHVHTRRTSVAAAITCIFFLVLQCAVDAHPQPQIICSKTCVAQNCDTVGIRYGKFCGIGWTGCPGEKPCDALDECCKLHDECVEKKGMTDVKCHEKFKSCIKKVRKSGKIGFSQDCPYETAMPTMMQGMDMAILLSKLGNRNFEFMCVEDPGCSSNQACQSSEERKGSFFSVFRGTNPAETGWGFWLRALEHVARNSGVRVLNPSLPIIVPKMKTFLLPWG